MMMARRRMTRRTPTTMPIMAPVDKPDYVRGNREKVFFIIIRKAI